jgi:hypothetical protein
MFSMATWLPGAMQRTEEDPENSSKTVRKSHNALLLVSPANLPKSLFMSVS